MVNLAEYEGFVVEEDDVPFEEDIFRNPYSVKAWWRYLEHKRTATRAVRNMIYERALKELPASYKLWYAYLRERRLAVRFRSPVDPAYEDLNNAYERCLVFMHKMPRMWIDYTALVVQQGKITKARHTFDRALRALPITQHHRIWPSYLKFVGQNNLPETAVRVYRRYLKLAPQDVEDYIDYLESIGRLDEAAVRLAAAVNDDKFVSKRNQSNHQLWISLCELLSKNATEITSVKAEPIIRAGIKRFSDMVGTLWVALADYFIRQGLFGKARDIFEEAVQTVMTVRDFSQVFEAYSQFEEGLIERAMEEEDREEIDVEMDLASFELLMDRRPILLNSVLLRQNPHNVHEWLKRATLFQQKPPLVVQTYTEAVQTVDPLKAVGKVSDLWIAFAKYYEDHEQLDESRAVYDRAVAASYKRVDDLAAVWACYAEMELRHGNSNRALSLVRQAVSQQGWDSKDEHQRQLRIRLHRSLKLWLLYLDLDEALGTFESTRAVYERVMDVKIATPQVVINYAMFLEENEYFEDAFKVYERGIALFHWPNVFDLWITYINKFIDRYKNTKLERTRDLFEQALADAPPKYAKTLYNAYAKLEEDHGLARHSMAVYDRAVKAVAPEDKLDLYKRYIRKAAESFGLVRTREIYQQAIEDLTDKESARMCQEYARLEVRLGEIDRARAIWSYGSQLCDPRVDTDYWDGWRAFEVQHGNEDTFRNMLRIKRSVEAMFMTRTSTDLASKLASTAPAGFVSGGVVGGDTVQQAE